MSKPKKPLLDKNIEKFIKSNFDKREYKNTDITKQFEWFVNSMHIWSISTTYFNSNTKIGKVIELGDSRGSDAFFISINDYEQIFTLEDNLEDVIQYIKSYGKVITFHFIQTKRTEHINFPDFLNLLDIPLTIWQGNTFGISQPILNKIKDFVDEITTDEDPDLRKLKHKLAITFYTNKVDSDLETLEKDWENDIRNKAKSFSTWFSQENISISFRGYSFLNEAFEKTISNDLELIVKKDNVIEVDLKKYLIGFITAEELLTCISYQNESNDSILKPDVFVNNIRLYLGRSPVNEKIEKTLLDEPSKFHFYNNGLTITTKSIEDSSKNFIIKSVNIVNGCQTANSIYNISRLDKNNLNEVKIPVKIIVAEDLEYEKITIRTNTQNGIDNKDLLSISATQKELEDFFKELKFRNASFSYIRQKSVDVQNRDDIDYKIHLDDILRAVFSTILLIPHKVTGYFDQTTAKYVDNIFDERFVKLYGYLTVLFKFVEDYIEEKEPDLKRLKYHILYIMYKKANFKNNHKEFEDFFRTNPILTQEELNEQIELISNTISNIYPLLKTEEEFTSEISLIINIIKDKYPNLQNLTTKAKERELYKPVEKLYRTRTTPIFETFEDNFITE